MTTNSDTSAPNSESPEFADAVARYGSGESVVVLVQADDGSASPLVQSIEGDVSVSSKLTCAQACRTSVGGVARDLELENFDGGVVVLEDAQWADPSSLGRLQRLVREGPHPYLLVLSHRPLADVDGWWLEQTAAAATRHSNLVKIELESTSAGDQAETLDSTELELVVATRLASPLTVPVAARLLDVTDSEVLDTTESLVARGLLDEVRGGFVPGSNSAGVTVGEARLGYVAGRLAVAMEEDGSDPAIVGGLRLAAGQHAEAFPILARAAREAHAHHASGEAFHLAESAIEAAHEAGLGDAPELGELHLICGRFLRTAGRTEWATRHLEEARARLRGEARVDALALAAAVADDAQHPQDGERVIALAELEAHRLDGGARLGSLLAFRARELHRIGLAEEADQAMLKSEAILADGGSPGEIFNAKLNRAWIHFDRGEAERAAMAFTQLRDEAGPLEGESSVADKEAWRARALFASGRPQDAFAAVRAAEELALMEDVEAPLFLTQLGVAEAGIAYGAYDDALAASEQALDLVERQFPAWENVVRTLRAQALLSLGRINEARADISRALEMTPSGANGWRWRNRCRAIQMEIEVAAGERWPAAEAEDLADLFLQSRLYGWAAELLIAIAVHGKRKSAAADALALASSIGLPMVAARAAHVGALWEDPTAGHAVLTMKAIESQISPDWEENWRRLPHVGSALAAPAPTDDDAILAATAAMEASLAKAGLADEAGALSPAQRRSQGLVRRPRGFSPLRVLAATLGIILLAGGTAWGVTQLTQPDTPATTLAEAVETTVPVTEPPSLEETVIAKPDDIDFFFGTAEHRGDQGRSGVVNASGVREAAGYYWKVPTAGAIEAAPIAFGTNVYVGTTEGTFYALNQTDGGEIWTMRPEGRIGTAPAIGMAGAGEGQFPMMIVVVDDNGVVRGHDAASDAASPWSERLDSPIRSSPIVVEGKAMVATTGGFVYSLDLLSGEILWQYPEVGQPGIGSITADLAYHEGNLYVGTEDGLLHILDVSSEAPSLVCEFDARAGITANPMIVDGTLYIPTQGNQVWVLPAGSCGGSVADRLPAYPTDVPMDIPPAIVGDVMYSPEGRYLYARNLSVESLADQPLLWTATVPGRPISSPPVVAGDTVYFASEDGVVHAVDIETGETLWQWQTELFVRASPAVIDGVVYIVGGDGFVYAVGG